jgi:hypothetical protein
MDIILTMTLVKRTKNFLVYARADEDKIPFTWYLPKDTKAITLTKN